jgi:hypothetical protein
MARARGSFGDIRTSPRNQKLLKWLRRKPQPAIVVGETDDGEERRAVVSATGPTQWTDVLSVVRACVHLEAIDKEGQVLRALDLDSDDPDLRAEDELEQARQRGSAAQPGSVPLISVDIPRLVDNLARNMREVASESARQQAGAFKEGFAAMTSVVNLCLGLLMRVDQRMAEIEDQADNARGATVDGAPQPNQREQLAMMALQRALGGNGAPSNGAAGLDMPGLLRMLQQFQGSQSPPEDTNA